jgi:tetratricopeptide (TPR) repeat protein
MKIINLILLLPILVGCSKPEQHTFLGPEAQFTESGLEYIIQEKGNGPHVELGNEITAACLLRLGDSTIIWEAPKEDPFNFVYSESGLIDGFIEAIGMMREGDKIKVIIPPDLGYGNRDSELIPANAYLSYEIDMLKVDDPQLWIADTLFLAFQEGGLDRGIERYQNMKIDTIRYNLNERQLGVLGSRLKRDGRLNDYFEIARIRAQDYPNSFGAHLNLANIHIERGEKSQAREELNKCLEIDPENPTAMRRLEEIR